MESKNLMSSVIRAKTIVIRILKCVCIPKTSKLLIPLGILLILCLSLIHTPQPTFMYKNGHAYQDSHGAKTQESNCPPGFVMNDYGDNDQLCVNKTRQREIPHSNLKIILMWNLAYGTKEYDIGVGREPFYQYRCPETRCYATSNRSYLKNVEDFDAILLHQRSFDFNDLPEKRKRHQRYVHWMQESAQYLYMDIHKLDGFFNWTMTYRRDSDFYLPYGRFHKIKTHPEGKELEKYIKDFGWRNRYLATNKGNRTILHAAWFVSHCATVARREKFVKTMQKDMDVDIYGKCTRGQHTRKCGREKEQECYKMMETNYKFYLSFENSLCEDYITEKYFNIFNYNVIPISFSGVNFSALSPPHSSISALDYLSPKSLTKFLNRLNKEDNLFAEYFWWRDFYVVRNRMEDRAQAYCDLCAKLNNPDQPAKIYKDMFKWWVTDSRCKKLKSSIFHI